MGKDAEFLEAARNGNVQVVEKFLTAKARRSGPLASLRRGPGANIQDSSGYTALHHASLNGHRLLVSTLLRHEALVDIQDNKGSTALHLAAWAGHDQVIKVLLVQGLSIPNVNFQNKAGDTALHFASQYGHTATVRLLLHHNGDPALPNLKAETPLDLAAHFGRLTIAELLIKQAKHDLLRPFAADAATTAVFPHTPLHLASRNGHLAVVKHLLTHGHHVNVRTSQGSALHEAALCGKVEVVRILMEAGADAEVKNDLGHTVLDTISSINTPVTQEISSLIKSHHARLIDLDEDEEAKEEKVSRSSPCNISSPPDLLDFSPLVFQFKPCSDLERPSSAPCFFSVRSSMKSSNCSHSVESTSSSPPCLPQNLLPSTFGCPYENVLLPTPASPSTGGESLSQTRDRRTSSRGSNKSYQLISDGGQTSDRDSRLSDKDAGRLSEYDCVMSVTSDSSFIYDVPSTIRRTSNKKYISTRSSSTHDVLDEDVYEVPPPPKKVIHLRRSLRDLSSDGELSTRPNPPPKPPRKSICPPSPTPTDGDDEGSYELICFATSGKYDRKVNKDSKSSEKQADSKSLGDYHYRTLGGGHSKAKKYSNYSSDSDSDSSQPGQRYQTIIPNKVYSNMTFKPVKSRRTTKANNYENTVHNYENVVSHHQDFKMYFDNDTTVVPLRSKHNNHDSQRIYAKKPKSMTIRGKASDFTSDDSEIDARPKSLNFSRGNGNHLDLMDQERNASRDQETVLNVQSTGVGSSLPPTDDEGLADGENQGVDSSSCSLSSASGTSVSDNIEEVKSDVPFAGLCRGSIKRFSDPPDVSDIPALERPRSLTSPASSFKDYRSNYHNLKTANNNNDGDKSDKSSMLSPLEEDEEWVRISEIMSSIGAGVARESVFMAELEREFELRMGMSLSPSQQETFLPDETADKSDKCELSEDIGVWLKEKMFAQYEATFLAQGYDHTHFLNGLLDNQELQDIGVTEKHHRDKLIGFIGELPATITTLSTNKPFESLSSWLSAINLAHYETLFLKHGFQDMERVRKIWEVELTVVLEVNLSGHRKRMLSSLGNRPIEPQLPASLAPHDLSLELSKLNSDISDLKEKLFNELPFSTSRQLRAPETATNTIRRGAVKRRAAPLPPPKAPRAQIDKIVDVKNDCGVFSKELALRDPSQLVVGFPNSSLTEWKHHPTKLIESKVQYFAQYLGSTHVKELKGTDSTMKSIEKLRQRTSVTGKMPNINLSVSYQGVTFIDGETDKVVCEHEIRNIHCACQDADDLCHFAYITKDIETQGHFCHIFRVNNKDLAAEIIMTLGQAFEIAYQITMRDQLISNQSDDEKITIGHTRSKSEHVTDTKSRFSLERSLSLVNNRLSDGGTTAPNTSLENLLSDSGNFSDKDCEAFSSSRKECSSPSASSNSTSGGGGGQQNKKKRNS